MIKIKESSAKFLLTVNSNRKLLLAFTLSVISVLVLYLNDLQILTSEATQNEASNYVLLLPFFFAFLIYMKRDVLKAAVALKPNRKTKYVTEILGMVVCIVAFLLYWYGSYTFYPLEYHIISLPIFISGITLILLNPRALRAIIFPLIFLLFLVPLPAEQLYAAGSAMSNFNTQITYHLLKTFGTNITLSSAYGPPTILISPSNGAQLAFAVNVSCSGIYSLIAFALFSTFLAFIIIGSLYKKLIIFATGFFVFALLNLIRIIAVVSVGLLIGEQAAVILHSFAGFVLIFIGMLLLITFADKILKVRIVTKTDNQKPCPECTTKKLASFCSNCGRFLNKKHKPIVSNKTFLKLLLLLLGVSMATLIVQAPTFATAKGQISLATDALSQNATNVIPQIPGYTLSYLYRDTAYEKVSGQDLSLMYCYFPNNQTNNETSNLIYVDIGVSNNLNNLHNWEVCLISWQTANGQNPLVNTIDSRDIQLLPNTPLVAQYLVFDHPDGYRQSTLYWYEKASFNTGISVDQKYVRISLIIMKNTGTDYIQPEQEIFKAAQPIASKWEPLKSQSLISLGVPALQTLLAASIALLIITTITQQLDQQRRAHGNQKIFNNFASKKERIVLQNIQELSKEKKNLTTNDIILSIQKSRGKPVNPKLVLHILNTLENNGSIKRTIISISNSPKQVWQK